MHCNSAGTRRKLSLRLFGNGVFGDDLPVELDRVIHHAGQFTDDDVQVGDAALAFAFSAWSRAILRMDWVTGSSCIFFGSSIHHG
jgi:hypothetical protein